MHIPRRNDLISAADFTTCPVDYKYPYLRERKLVQVSLQTVAGAPTPGQRKLVINHTRIGPAHKLHGSAIQVLRKKQTILRHAIGRSTHGTGASTPGIVVGDLNLASAQVQSVLQDAAGDRGHVRMFGGQGHAWQ